ncbi:MAG: carboxypeptidase regulatory-like domain-containing protein [Euryarchaeota archaeon]|nr:carboxypeptidase regulatory-like domain-containing protein [Euryarchaeota archaeon]
MMKVLPAVLALMILMLSPTLASTQVSAQAPGEWHVAGAVVNETGAPFPGVNVTAVNTTTGSTYFSISNITGDYNITLPSGTYNVSASLLNYSANRTYVGVIIDSDLISVLNFTMTEMLGTLAGHVTNGTAPIVGATVYLRSALYNYSGLSTGPLGEYSLTRVRPGTYVAYAEKTGYWTAYHTEPVVIVRGRTTMLNFTLDEQPAKLFGKVTWGGSPVVGVQVMLQSATFTTSTNTDANGNYTVSNVPTGSYTLDFRKQGYVDKSIQISLSPFEEKRYDVVLDKEPVEGSTGFIPGFDLPHSLMIVGLILAIIILIASIIIRHKIGQKPELLAVEEEPEKKEEVKSD